MEEKKGIITEVIFHNGENGYTICEMETEDELLTCVGSLPSAAKGTCFVLQGNFTVHPRYGEQFAFTEAVEVMPETDAGIEAFLASGVIKGVGPKTATAIVSVFGEDTFRIMEWSPEKLCQVPGIGMKKADVISASFLERREFAEVSMYFQQYGISAVQALKLFKGYGKDAVKLIKENPYRLVDEIYGFGFKKADDIARKMGFKDDSPFRIRSGIKYGLMDMSGEGNTFVPKGELCQQVGLLLDVPRDAVEDQLLELAVEGAVRVDDIDGEKVVYLFHMFRAEQQVCRNIGDLVTAELKTLAVDIEGCIRMTEETKGVALSEKQRLAVGQTATSGVSVITGGPGTGKTTIIDTLINIFEEGGLSVAIAAPTGRAAKRITETTGRPASTIHRLLAYQPAGGDETAPHFNKNEESPLEEDVIIVDEASMIDLILMKGLTDAIKPGSRFILVGDSDQLPSVGAGNVLGDLIASGFVHTARLTEIFRQAEESMIVVNAHRINKGEYPYLNSKDKDFFFMERRSEMEMQELMVELVTKRLPNYYKDIEPVRDIQVLSPTRKGQVGTVVLNKVLQEAFNPPAEGIPEKKYGDKLFRKGDKVMQIKNNYQLEWRTPGGERSGGRGGETGEGVFNGDVGRIVSIDNEYGSMTVVFDEDRYVEYDFSQLDELELAYAVTVHKSQGSEFPVVVMPISWFPPMLATRNLLYTAITRGKDLVVLVGSEAGMRGMVDNDRIKLRYSGLRYRLEQLMMFNERE